MKTFNLYGDEWDEPRDAHPIINRTESPIRVLMLSSMIRPDIVEYLDTGKIGVRRMAGDRIMLARPGPNLDYLEGEN